MGYVIYQGEVEKLSGHAPFGDGGCVALVKEVTTVGFTGMWRPGPRVVDLSYLNQGTVIANFLNGRFPNLHRYHAALFLRTVRSVTGKVMGIWVMDQFRGRFPSNLVMERYIPCRGDKSYKDGNTISDCDNADQFCVVMI